MFLSNLGLTLLPSLHLGLKLFAQFRQPTVIIHKSIFLCRYVRQDIFLLFHVIEELGQLLARLDLTIFEHLHLTLQCVIGSLHVGHLFDQLRLFIVHVGQGIILLVETFKEFVHAVEQLGLTCLGFGHVGLQCGIESLQLSQLFSQILLALGHGRQMPFRLIKTFLQFLGLDSDELLILQLLAHLRQLLLELIPIGQLLFELVSRFRETPLVFLVGFFFLA
mmetsp:Transcript_32421/g.58603  ORF Transcript_32421/g.58603 Transcript_32421/m.58603 type:complete len:221 (+) Transcript_32421:617-1279(+)